QLLRRVDDLLEGDVEEGRDLELDDGPPPGERGSGREAGERLFGDRRVEHALLAELLDQPLRDAAQRRAHVLADHEDGRIGEHRVPKRLLQRMLVAHPAHVTAPARGRVPSAYTKSSAVPGSGCALLRAN